MIKSCSKKSYYCKSSRCEGLGFELLPLHSLPTLLQMWWPSVLALPRPSRRFRQISPLLLPLAATGWLKETNHDSITQQQESEWFFWNKLWEQRIRSKIHHLIARRTHILPVSCRQADVPRTHCKSILLPRNWASNNFDCEIQVPYLHFTGNDLTLNLIDSVDEIKSGGVQVLWRVVRWKCLKV